MLRVGTLVKEGRYKIASMPYTSKEFADKDIAEDWQDITCTTYHYEKRDEWYIIVPVV